VNQAAKPPAAVRELMQAGVALAPLTSLGLGGSAEHFVRVESREALIDALRFAREHDLPVTVLGGGSNVVISDAGIAGMTIAIATRGVSVQRDAARVIVQAQAGEPWDALVARCVADDLAGLECLSGIPGLVGATPIQNVGAYGQEVSDTIAAVEVLDRESLQVTTLAPSACDFAYRHSAFKRAPARYVVLSVSFALTPGGAPALRYAELTQALAHVPSPSLEQTRACVLALRAKKSMLLDPHDANFRSAGSFFTNPIVSSAQADAVAQRALAAGLIADAAELPRYPQADGRVKLAAGWLIERSGTHKGERLGAVGVSTRHALALVHHGGARTQDLIELAKLVRARVEQRFGVTLVAEPVLLGFATEPLR
jgi:UDP-N-acetylmuramate dehydrogenase